MRRIFCLSIGLLLAVSAMAQTQQGYVKTLSRPDKKGGALAGVTVRVKGGHNVVVSSGNGTFSMLLDGTKKGDAYSLQQVQKKDYELNDRGVIGRQYAFSDKVPLTIVMVSSSQLQADKQRIENNAYQVAEKNYHVKLAKLEKEKESGAVTAETYRQELKDLQDKFEKYQSLIDDLADHYAHVDYDDLDDKEREINMCIEAGNLERADSLLHTIFDPVDVLKRNKEVLSRIDQKIVQANDIIRQANADMAAVLKQQEKDAEYLYQLYTIALAKFDNEKARFYIETRAELDTTNVEWQMNAGGYMDYIGKYDSALKYYQRSLEIVRLQESGSILQQYYCLSHIGTLYCKKGKYEEALNDLQKAQGICEQFSDDKKIEQVLNQFNIGEVYRQKGDLPSSLRHYNQAIVTLRDIMTAHQDDTSFFIAPSTTQTIWTLYMNWAEVQRQLGKYDEALKMLEELRSTYHLDEVGDNFIYAQVLNNTGMIYYQKNQYTKALEYYLRSLGMYRNLFGDMHPSIALLYNNMGELYRTEHKTDLALECQEKALDIRKACYGNLHPLVAQSLSNMGLALNEAKRYEEALPCFQEAVKIYKDIEHPNKEELATVENNRGMSYYFLNDYAHADQCFAEALASMKQNPSVNFFLWSTIYSNLYAVNDKLNHKSLSAQYRWEKLVYYGKLIENNDFYNSDHYKIDRALEYLELGDQYAELGDTASLTMCYQQSMDILAGLPQKGNSEYADIYLKKGAEDYVNRNLDDAEKYLRRASCIYKATFGEKNKDVVSCYSSLAAICLGKNRLSEGAWYIDKVVSIMEEMYPNGHPDLCQHYFSQGSLRFVLQGQDISKYAKDGKVIVKIDDYGTEDIFNKLLAVTEKYYPNDDEKMETAVSALIKQYYVRFALGEKEYKSKLQVLAAKHPKYAKPAIEGLMQNMNKQGGN